MKKLFLLLISLPTLIYAVENTRTNNPDVYIKDMKCEHGFQLSGNLVNKSQNTIVGVRADFFDKDGDPIDSKRLDFLMIPANTGKLIEFIYACKAEDKYKITVW